MPDPELTELLASYVPRLIQKRVAQNPVPIDTPLAQDFLAVVMFADISGFTALTERLAEKGSAGVEKLARILNDYFGQWIDVVYDVAGMRSSHSGQSWKSQTIRLRVALVLFIRRRSAYGPACRGMCV